MTPLPVGAPGTALPAVGVASSGAAAAPAMDETITGTGRENWTNRARSNPAARQSPEALEIGTLLANRYEIVRTIGVGGMGAVYQARDLQLNRLVALKVIRPDLAKDPEIVDRFKQELILARQVTHKNVSTANQGLSRKTAGVLGVPEVPSAMICVSRYLIVSRGARFVIEEPLSNVALPFSLLFRSMNRAMNTALNGLVPRL
jgi:hypothetical protein